MKTYWSFAAEMWDMKSHNGHSEGDQVRVNKPDDVNHGQVGRIMRQQALEYGVEFPHNMDKLHWYHASHLHKPA